MKYRKISLIALSAALLLSGCNTDKAVTTTADNARRINEYPVSQNSGTGLAFI